MSVILKSAICSQLRELNLRYNNLISLPLSIVNLKNLRFLDLRANNLNLENINLSYMPSLERLDLRWNKLSSLPTWVEDLEARGCVVYNH